MLSNNNNNECDSNKVFLSLLKSLRNSLIPKEDISEWLKDELLNIIAYINEHHLLKGKSVSIKIVPDFSDPTIRRNWEGDR